jgi:hypothetical protein
LGISGAAIAQDTDTDRSTSIRDGSTKEAPAAGAIVMPNDVVKPDRPSTLNDPNARPGARNDELNDDNTITNDDRLSVDPGPLNDGMTVIPGRSTDDMSVDPGRAGVRPGDMGPADMRGE